MRKNRLLADPMTDVRIAYSDGVGEAGWGQLGIEVVSRVRMESRHRNGHEWDRDCFM